MYQNMNSYGCYIINNNHHDALGYKLNTILDKSYGKTTMASRWKELKRNYCITKTMHFLDVSKMAIRYYKKSFFQTHALCCQ